MGDDISLPQIIVSEAVPDDTAYVIPVNNTSQQHLDYSSWLSMIRHKSSHTMNMVIDAAYKIITTDNHNGTYTHTYIPRDVISLKFTREIVPEQPIMGLYSGGRGINHARLGSTLDDWLKEEGINHEVNQEALRRVLAWQSTKQSIRDQNYNNSSLNQVLTDYQAKPLANLYEVSYGVLSKFKTAR